MGINQNWSHTHTKLSYSHHRYHTWCDTYLKLIMYAFIYVGEFRSTLLFRISIPWVVRTNMPFQPNNSANPGKILEIIHCRQQRDEIQLGFHLHYENEKQSLPCQGTLHSYDLVAFTATPCQINLCWIQHKNDINHTLIPDSGHSIDSVLVCILCVILAQKTSQTWHNVWHQCSLYSITRGWVSGE